MVDSSWLRKSRLKPAFKHKVAARPLARIPGEDKGSIRRDRRRSSRVALSAVTILTYRRDWHRFASWCKANRVHALPCRPDTLIRYLDERAVEAPRSVLLRELIVICRTHRAVGERSPRQHPLVRQWIRNYKDDSAFGSSAVVPIEAAHFTAMATRLYEITHATPQTSGQRRRHFTSLRDRALILIAKAARLRAINIRKLTLGDVKVGPKGLALRLHRSKYQGGDTSVTIPRAASTTMCPVVAWQAWLKAAPGEPSAPAFPLLAVGGRRHNKPVGPTDVCISLKRALHAVGVDPAPYTEDSLAAV